MVESENYYVLADYNKQTSHIQSSLCSKAVKHHRKPMGDDASVQSQTCEYKLMYNNVVHKVCKPGFLSISAISDKHECTAFEKVSVTSNPLAVKCDKVIRYKTSEKVIALIEKRSEYSEGFIALYKGQIP